MVALPAVGGSRVLSILMSVLLPAPFGPIRPRISPALAAIETRSTASVSPKRLVSSVVCTANAAVWLVEFKIVRILRDFLDLTTRRRMFILRRKARKDADVWAAS